MENCLINNITLEACLDAPIARYFDAQLDKDPDVLAQLLADKRNPNTKRAYEKDIKDFFVKMTGLPPTGDSVLEFLHLRRLRRTGICGVLIAKR